MTTETLIQQLRDTLVAASITIGSISEMDKLGVVLRVSVADVTTVMDALLQSEELQFEQLIDTFGADVRGLIEVTYRLRSLGRNVDVLVKTELPYGATLPSVWEVYPSALLPERELCEMFGLSLEGHPNPKRMLTTEGLPPFLRKEVLIRDQEAS